MVEENTVVDGDVVNSPSDTAANRQDKGVFVPLIFGGAVATALGFFGGQLDSVEEALGWAEDDAQFEQVIAQQRDALAAQDEKINALAEQIAQLTAKIEALPDTPAQVDLSGIEGAVSSTRTELETLTQRLTDLEKRPMTEGLSQDAIAAYEAELDRLKSTVQQELQSFEETAASQRSEIEALLNTAKDTEAEAARKEALARARAALASVMVALDNGAPYADLLSELDAASDAEIPAALSGPAETGVATLVALQADFPLAARSALSAARSEQSESEGGGFGSFLQRQLGARSVTPREGSDPNAVLSRAEAAVRAGQLGTALSEIDTLPETAKSAMADWISAADTRAAAMSAAQDVSAALGSN
ncbi:hypothetical protein E4Z66_16675 [Aliishimia ponticola]|uniref:Phage tail protein n=1 Tax=Aliishimia ponticola TaxID=2499833 RepID=A0A4S4N666_9RHOB|nr:hypothetical protein [Aliishimia ponticola]THH34614.1 hypothetical protein E4Z66_16675 [Aliishimia ponticola]